MEGKLRRWLRKLWKLLEEGVERDHYTELFADQLIDAKTFLEHMKRIDEKYDRTT